MGPPRRHGLAVLAAVCLLAFASVAGAATPAVSPQTAQLATPPSAQLTTQQAVLPTTLQPTASVGSQPSPTNTGPTIVATHTFERGTDPERVRLRLQYELPTSITDFRVLLPELSGESVSVVAVDGFERQDQRTFAWTRGSRTPSVTVSLAVSTGDLTATDHGIARDGWAFATVPGTKLDVSYTGSRPQVTSSTTTEGDGYGSDRMAFMGDHSVVRTETGSEQVTFIAGSGSEPTNLSAAQAFLERAEGRFDFGVSRDRLVVFVLPFAGQSPANGQVTVTGEAYGDAFWVTADATTVSGPTNAFAHEYVHSRLGDTGNGSALWLTEASAEYYGMLATLNSGGSSYEAFTEATSAERFGPNRTAVVLSEPESWRGTLGNYEKGAHVLAALDAEIRTRTDGERTLYDVFVSTQSFDDYGEFRASVIRTAGDDSLGPWLDRYVTTDALPPLPEEPTRYVLGADLDPDADGLTSEAERSGTPQTNPFVADTDDDGLDDGRERSVGTDPTDPDTDGDTLADGQEIERGTDPTHPDTDDDGVNDALDAYPTDPSAGQATQTAETTSEPGEKTGTATALTEESPANSETKEAETAVETRGFGGVVVVGTIAALTGMLCRRKNRETR